MLLPTMPLPFTFNELMLSTVLVLALGAVFAITMTLLFDKVVGWVRSTRK